MLGGAGSAFAADLSTMPVKAIPIADQTCSSIIDFFTTACQVSAYGVRFYGAVDIGGAYQTHGAPMSSTIGYNAELAKSSRGGMWVAAPNELSVSNIGLQIKEGLGGGWSFVGQVEAGFNPYSLRLLDAPASLRSGVGVPLARQDAITDANFNGQFYNDLGYAGFSHPVWGTLTFGRQNTLGSDQVLAYDPMQSAGGFSPLGLVGSWAGGGNTENRRDTMAAKYRVAFANWHFGAYAAFGGYSIGNADTAAYSGNIGADWHVGGGLLSADLTGGWRQNSISEGPGGISGPNGLDGFPTGIDTAGNETLNATVNNTTQLMFTAKYEYERWKLFGGINVNWFSAPSDPGIANQCITDQSGFPLGNCGIAGISNINATLLNGRVFSIAWIGARYALTDSVDVTGAYYHSWQNTFTNGSGPGIPFGKSTTCSQTPDISIECAGTQDFVSVLVDWKFAPKWDTYAGMQYTQYGGGITAGYISRNDLTTSAGIRFRW